MKMKTKTWRLKERPTIDGLIKLIDKKVINTEQANKILFREEEIDQEKLREIKEEIKLLRTLVLELASKQASIIVPVVEKRVEIIKESPWPHPWYEPYVTWCSSNADYSSTSFTGNSTTR